MLTKKELLQITGGGFKLAASIGAAIVFILGLIDGVLKQEECTSAK